MKIWDSLEESRSSDVDVKHRNNAERSQNILSILRTFSKRSRNIPRTFQKKRTQRTFQTIDSVIEIIWSTLLMTDRLLFSFLFFSSLLFSPFFSPPFFSPVLFCFVLFCSVLFCSVLFCSVLFCSVLFCSALFCPLYHLLTSLLYSINSLHFFSLPRFSNHLL